MDFGVAVGDSGAGVEAGGVGERPYDAAGCQSVLQDGEYVGGVACVFGAWYGVD